MSAAEDYSRAALIAESVLTETASVKPLKETTSEGTADDGRIRWTARVAAYAPPGVPPELEQAAQIAADAAVPRERRRRVSGAERAARGRWRSRRRASASRDTLQ